MSEGRITFPARLIETNINRISMKQSPRTLPITVGDTTLGEWQATTFYNYGGYDTFSDPTIEIGFYIVDDPKFDLGKFINSISEQPKKKVYINGKCVGEVDTDRDMVIK